MFISTCTNVTFAALYLTVKAEKSWIVRQIQYKKT